MFGSDTFTKSSEILNDFYNTDELQNGLANIEEAKLVTSFWHLATMAIKFLKRFA